MFGFNQQFQFATELTSMFVDAASTMAKGASGSLSLETSKAPGRSWYRCPADNPFDPSTWIPASQLGWAPFWDWNGTVTRGPFGQSAFVGIPFAYQPWSSVAAFANSMVALQSMPASWTCAPSAAGTGSDLVTMAWQTMMAQMALATDQFAALASADDRPVEHASDLSKSGHGVVPAVGVSSNTKASQPIVVGSIGSAAQTVH
jgi:hypothetical protein